MEKQGSLYSQICDIMKIVIYSTQVIPTNPDIDEYGGLELIAGLQAKYFDEKGHDVSLFACKDRSLKEV